MDQLLVLHEIFESFTRGGESLESIDPGSIRGSCSALVGKLLDRIRKGEMDTETCQTLAGCLTDLYEIKRLGDICRRGGLSSVAVQCYNKALSLTQDPSVRAVLLNNLGQVYARQGDLSRAVLYYSKAADGFRSSGDTSGEAHVLGNLGSAYRKGYDFEKAIEHCVKSLKLFEEQKDALGAAQMTGSLGRIYAEMGQHDLAMTYYQRSLRNFQSLGDRRSVAWLHNRIGRVKAKLKDWDGSSESYGLSLQIFQELGQTASCGIVMSNLGRMHLDRGSAKEAYDTLLNATKIMRKEMEPVYPNALSCLAASCSILGRQTEMGAVRSIKDSRSKDAKAALQDRASTYYSQAADYLTQLSTNKRIFLPPIKVAAGFCRALSYLSRLKSEVNPSEAVAIMERSAAALKSASAGADARERARIDAIERILLGMKQIWSVDLMKNEPWGIMRSMGFAVDHMLQGSKAIKGDEGPSSSGDIWLCLYDALRSIAAAFESERGRRSPADQLKLASSHLKRAQRRMELAGSEIESSSQIQEAARLIDRLAGTDSSSNWPEAVPGEADKVSNMLNYRAHRQALLLIGWVLIKGQMAEIDRSDWIYVWDEGMNLVEFGRAGSPDSMERVRGTITEDLADIILEPSVMEAELLQETTIVNPSRTPNTEHQIAIAALHERPKNIAWLVPVSTSLVNPSYENPCKSGPKTSSRASKSFDWDDSPVIQTSPCFSYQEVAAPPRSYREIEFHDIEFHRPKACDVEPQSTEVDQERGFFETLDNKHEPVATVFEEKRKGLFGRIREIDGRSLAIKVAKLLIGGVIALLAADLILYILYP